MAINNTFTLTEAAISAKYSYPTPYTYISLNDVAVGSLNYTDPVTAWTISSTVAGTDLDITVDETLNPSVASGPGDFYDMESLILHFQDSTGEDRYVHIQIRVFYEIPNVPPVGIDDGTTIEAGNTSTIDVILNDTDSDGTVNSATNVANVDPVLTVVAGANPGEFDVTVAAGTAPGDYTFEYQPVDDDGSIGNVTTVTVTVPLSLGDVYFEARGIVAGETFNWDISSPEGNVTVKKADGTIVGTGASGSFVVPAGDAGETYFVVDDTTIASTWGIWTGNNGSDATTELYVVNNLLSAVFYSSADNLKRFIMPAQNYPNFTLLNHSGGAELQRLEMLGTYPNGNIRINANMDAASTQYVHLPDQTQVDGVGGNINNINIRNLDAAGATYLNWRAASNGGNVVGNSLVDLPAGNNYNQNVSFISSTGTGFSLPPAAYATVATVGAGPQINFNGSAGWDFTDDTNVYHVGHWLVELVNAGRDTTNFGELTALGIWVGDVGGYGTTSIFTPAAQAAANALAGTPPGTTPTNWVGITSAEFRV